MVLGRDRLKSCARKKRYATRGSAAIGAKDAGQRFYECSFCKGYHLTKKGAKTVQQVAEDLERERANRRIGQQQVECAMCSEAIYYEELVCDRCLGVVSFYFETQHKAEMVRRFLEM